MRTILRFSKSINSTCCGRKQLAQLTRSVKMIDKNMDKTNKELHIASTYGILNFLILNTSLFLWVVRG